MRSLAWALIALGAATAVRATEPVFLLHAAPESQAFCESLDDRGLRCSQIQVSPSGSEDLFVWVLVSDVDGEIGGAQFGIQYDATVSVQAWLLCTGANQIPTLSWPASGEGIAVIWPDGCYRTGSSDMAKIGFFYVARGSSGRIRIVDHPDPGTAPYPTYIARCQTDPQVPAQEIEACEYNGLLALGGIAGFLPANCRCSGPPSVESTWSSIKNSYR